VRPLPEAGQTIGVLPTRRWGARPVRVFVCLALLASLVISELPMGRAQDSNELRLAGPVIGPETLDPVLMRDLSAVEIVRQVFRGLMYFDDELNPVPELAESYTVSKDGLTYRFTLREGIAFHSGRPIVPDDVVYSLSRSVNPDTAGGDPTLLSGPPFLADIEGYTEVVAGEADLLSGVTALSDREVEIRLSAPRATFLMRLASFPAVIVDREQVEGNESWYLHPNGSGPFEVEKWDFEEELVLRAFEDYALGKPGVERIAYRLGNRAVQSFNLYQDSEIDIDHVTLFDLDRATDPNGEFADEVIGVPQFTLGYIALRTDVEPLDDPGIRRALQLAFPRDRVASIVFNGLLNQANGIIPLGMLDADWSDEQLVPDLDAAREAIATSRYGAAENVPPIRIYTAGALASEVLRDVADAELGLKIEVFELEWHSFLDRQLNGPMPAHELSWVADYPDPEGILLPLWGTNQPDNSTGYSNPVVDELLAEAAAELDSEARIGIYREAQRQILADNVVIPTFFDVEYTVRKPWVRGLTVTPMGILRLETIRIDE
jgi:ABC-type transport system substrate-binding protein